MLTIDSLHFLCLLNMEKKSELNVYMSNLLNFKKYNHLMHVYIYNCVTLQKCLELLILYPNKWRARSKQENVS